VLLVWDERCGRLPRLEADELRCGGPLDGFQRRIAAYLRSRALQLLSKDTAEITAAAGLTARSVSVGDAATRWGSCTSEGRIRYSWRLVHAPPEVRRYIVAHEVAHLAHLNHGAEFKSLEAKLYGAPIGPAKRLLARLTPRLRRLGRG
jgi:predicted metal-dependent hydrolase